MRGAWVGGWTVAVQLESHCRAELPGSREQDGCSLPLLLCSPHPRGLEPGQTSSFSSTILTYTQSPVFWCNILSFFLLILIFWIGMLCIPPPTCCLLTKFVPFTPCSPSLPPLLVLPVFGNSPLVCVFLSAYINCIT